jgi:hypothetical protein
MIRSVVAGVQGLRLLTDVRYDIVLHLHDATKLGTAYLWWWQLFLLPILDASHRYTVRTLVVQLKGWPWTSRLLVDSRRFIEHVS